MTSRTTEITRYIEADPESVYRALVDADLVAAWRYPEEMEIEVHEYDLRVGGRFRMSLTYHDPEQRGKTSGHTDTYHGAFTQLEPYERVEQELEFDTADPAMQGRMTMSFILRAEGEGTVLQATHANVPPGVALEANELGWTMALDKLAALLERNEGR